MTNIVFGSMQHQMSGRMKKYPGLARLVKRIFGYTLVGNYARALTFSALLEKLPLKDIRSVLDLGCGYGEYAFMMAEALPQATVTALDINAQSVAAIDRLAKTNGYHNLETHIGTIDTLEEKDGTYDFIFSVDVFEHIKEEEMPFAQSYQKLKTGGHLLVKIPNKDQLTILPEQWFEDHHHWLEDEHIGQVYDLAGLVARMEREGFKVIYSAYGDGWWSRLGWELGYLSHKAGPVLQLLCLPLAKLMVKIDFTFHHRRTGNTIQVIGQKIG
ncbi:MAG: class I SAM-dependent methyltransferase [Saprospiraceae bacterium]